MYMQYIPPKCICTLNNYSFQWLKSDKKDTSIELSYIEGLYIGGDTLYIIF